MSTGGQNKLAARTAPDVCKDFPVGEEARKLLKEGMAARPFLDALMERKLYLDAIRFLAQALPKREAVWWACLCVRQVSAKTPPPPALPAAEKWVRDPSEDNRRAAQPAAEAAGLGTPSGCAAMAAFWSGGSLAPANVPVVPPPPHLTGHGVAGAVLLAAVASEPEKAPDKHLAFLRLGLDVATGKNLWG